MSGDNDKRVMGVLGALGVLWAAMVVRMQCVGVHVPAEISLNSRKGLTASSQKKLQIGPWGKLS